MLAESLERVHTHTHTHYMFNEKRNNTIKERDRNKTCRKYRFLLLSLLLYYKT